MYLDGSNAENKISLLVILCIIMYVKKKENSKPIFFFFTKPIMVKCLNIGKISVDLYSLVTGDHLIALLHRCDSLAVLGLRDMQQKNLDRTAEEIGHVQTQLINHIC